MGRLIGRESRPPIRPAIRCRAHAPCARTGRRIAPDPLWREEIYQRLHLGTRWVYQPPGWFGNFDNCLWDIAGKVAGLPVCQLIGQVRDRIPAYHTGDDGPGSAEHYLQMLADVRER